MLKFLSIFFIATVLFIKGLSAQTWEAGGTLAASGYIGDFNLANPLQFNNVAGGVFIKRNLNGFLSIKFSYMYGSISGADSMSYNKQLQARNLSFSSSISEFSLIGEFNFIDYIPEVGFNKFTPFIFAGIGSAGYNPMATYKGQDYALRPLMTEGQINPYGKSAFVIPYGAGIKFNFTGKWNFIADLGYRHTNTPYLDDVSGNYTNKAFLSSPVAQALSDRSGESTSVYLGSPGTQRGNYSRNDSYMFLGLTLSYTFVTLNCPRF